MISVRLRTSRRLDTVGQLTTESMCLLARAVSANFRAATLILFIVAN